ncbi:outer membrane protein assembly factor BamC [Vibrio sp. Of7-15]|uniref:outer membrane protein assembly factor BamC n=1 Tax=Vibrio sp. Of7-15 TaxID=2724879 RepID=UPI001EF2631C|nr:outer membrane protein assembly factor BamC [Vibrio sp. Of7-15]MCG7498435.1 outer membrane protein assembly factor BamC [Vibrio sp. Of7-15]
MKFKYRFVLTSVMAVSLAACSGNPTERRQAKQDFTYMETTPFKVWNQPEGSKVEFSSFYAIPEGNFNGELGPGVDIRPPQQVLQLIPGARADLQNGEVTLWLVKEEELTKVWQTALDLIAKRNIPLRSQDDSRLETDWVSWISEDEDTEIGSRYVIEKTKQAKRHGFKITLVDWKEAGKVQPVSATNKERYNILMTNLVTSAYDQQVRDDARVRAQELVKQIPISMGQDRSGLPVIIARAPYNVFWERLPDLLPKVGLTMEGRNRSQGQVQVKYRAPDDAFWQEIGTKPLAFEGKTYNLLLGDLGNRTSINVTDGAGKPVSEEVLTSLAPVLAAAVDRANTVTE